MTLKEQFKRSFAYTWYLYVLAIALPSVAFPLAYSFMHRPKENEKLTLFISCDIETSKLEDLILEKFKDDGVKTVDAYSYNADGNELMFEEKLKIVGINSADILIVPEYKLDSIDYLTNAVELVSEVKEKCNITDEEIFKYENFEYAVNMPENTPISEFVSFKKDTKYYAFFGGKSANVGKYSLSDKTSENAFKLMSYLLGK